MTPRTQTLVGAGLVGGWIVSGAVVEFVASRPLLWTVTITTVALAGIAAGIFQLARPR